MPKHISKGACLYCKAMHTDGDLDAHLTAHLEEHEAAITNDKKEAFHLKVTAGPYFLHILVDGEDDLGYLDEFLRKIWLECCGHLSSFTVDGKEYETSWDMDSDIGEKMETLISNVFEMGETVTYTYDYGSTTQLKIEVVGEYQLSVADIMLLSRNEPFKMLCHTCKKANATDICVADMATQTFLFCRTCSKADEDGSLPIVNSPRVGVCGYTGGEIDEERDKYKGK